MASVEAENPVTGQITCGSLLHQPQQIWDEDGESDEDRDNILLQLEQECLNVCRRKVDLAVSSDACLSMGAFLLSAGTKGKRYILPNTRIMIHQPLGGA